MFANLARGFLEHGLAVDMVQATPDGGFRDRVPSGVRFIDLNASRALTSVGPLIRYLRRDCPDAMICGAIQTNIAAVWAKRLARVPTRVILTEHNIISAITKDAPMLRTQVTPFFVRRFYPWADDLIAVSQGAANDLASVTGLPANRVHVIYNPVVGPELWKRAAEPLEDEAFIADSRPAILAVGRLHYHKDYPTLLRAMAIVCRTVNARLVFLGDGEERANLSSLAQELGLESCVSFLGDVANPLPYMKRAAVLALSSIVEALPTVLIEALAVGLPIVATDCPTGPREILCDGAYGTLLPVRDSVAMAQALLHVLRQSERPAVSEEALARFSFDNAMAKYLAILGVAASTRPPSYSHAGIGTTEK